MIIKEFEIVVNEEYGGFHLDAEMALWLMEQKHWRVTENDNDFETTEYDLVGMKDCFWPTKKYGETEFRMHADLLECVKELKKKYEAMSYLERKRSNAKVLDFRIVTTQVNIEVEDIDDGIEQVKCWITTL